jgi:hypothetical protein
MFLEGEGILGTVHSKCTFDHWAKVVEDFNTPCSIIDRVSRQIIIKEIDELTLQTTN